MTLRLLADRKVWLLAGADGGGRVVPAELFEPARVIESEEELIGALASDAPAMVWRAAEAVWAAGARIPMAIRAAAPECALVEVVVSEAPWVVAGHTDLEAAAMIGVALERGRASARADDSSGLSGDLIERLLARSNEAVAMVDMQGRVLPGSPVLGRILGMRPDRMIGQKGFDLLVDEERERGQQIFAEVLSRPGETLTFEATYNHTDGGTRVIEHIVVNLLDDPEVKAIVVNARDVTQLRSLQADAQRRRELAALGRVAGRVAHDFNNLLAILRVNADRISKADPGLRLGEVGEVMVRTVEQGARLTQNLLAFGRLQVLDPVHLELGAWLHSLLPELAGGLGPAVRLTCRADEAQWAWVDQTRLGHTVAALVQNAVDASGGQGDVEISVETWRAPPGARGVSGPLDAGPWRALRVRDAGEGMDADTQAHAAEPFFTTRGLKRGGGLGLSMVHGFAAQSGGDICFESRCGEGAVVSIVLPVSEPPEPQVVDSGLKDHRDHAPQSQRRLGILLVEDEPDLRATLLQYLELVGHQVFPAGTGREGMRVALREFEAIDVVVTDVILPGLGGVDLMTLLHDAGFDWPVLYISGLTETADLGRIVPGAGVAFLRKPFGMNDLVVRLQQLTQPPECGP